MHGTVDQHRSFAYFIYPFLFDVPLSEKTNRADAQRSDDPFCTFCRQVGVSKLDGKAIWAEWPSPSTDLMPSVAGFLQASSGKPTGRFWQLSNDIAQKHLAGAKTSWRLMRGKNADPIPFIPGGDPVVHLALFRHGVGFVTVSARPLSDDLDDWLDFLHHFRFMQHRGNVRIAADKEGYDTGTQQKSRVAHIPLGVSASSDGTFCFMDVITALLRASALGQGPRDVFTPGHTLPHAAMFAIGVADGDKPAVLHGLRNFFRASQCTTPSDSDLQPDHPANLAYAHDQWFLQTLNGGSFVAFEDALTPQTDFQKSDLPAHLRGVYFCASLLALYQRFALAQLSEQVATEALDGGGERWEQIRDGLLDFTARGYFVQAMQTDHHHRYYRKWQEVLQIPQLYEEVRDEVRDMYERASMQLRKRDDAREAEEEQREKRFEKLLTILGAIFIVPSLILGFLGVNLRGITSGAEGIAWYSVAALVLISMGAGGLLLWGLTSWLGHADKRKGGGSGV